MSPEQINELVARRLGWMPDVCGAYPDYCRDIKAAWEIVQNAKFYVELSRTAGGRWLCLLGDLTEGIFADTAPMAIALCFLKLNDQTL